MYVNGTTHTDSEYHFRFRLVKFNIVIYLHGSIFVHVIYVVSTLMLATYGKGGRNLS